MFVAGPTKISMSRRVSGVSRKSFAGCPTAALPHLKIPLYQQYIGLGCPLQGCGRALGWGRCASGAGSVTGHRGAGSRRDGRAAGRRRFLGLPGSSDTGLPHSRLCSPRCPHLLPLMGSWLHAGAHGSLHSQPCIALTVSGRQILQSGLVGPADRAPGAEAPGGAVHPLGGSAAAACGDVRACRLDVPLPSTPHSWQSVVEPAFRRRRRRCRRLRCRRCRTWRWRRSRQHGWSGSLPSWGQAERWRRRRWQCCCCRCHTRRGHMDTRAAADVGGIGSRWHRWQFSATSCLPLSPLPLALVVVYETAQESKVWDDDCTSTKQQGVDEEQNGGRWRGAVKIKGK